jgi:hypothetical protein
VASPGPRRDLWHVSIHEMGRMQYIDLKVTSASWHLDGLKAALEEYYGSVPIVISRQAKPEVGRRILRIDLRAPNDDVYLLAGDFAHNLRSALDHLVYALIVHSTRELPDSSQVQWPVQARRDDGAFARQTTGVPPVAAAVIKSLQPYLEGPGEAYKESALWQLHKLDVIDKHRRIAINQHATQPFFPGLSPSSDFVAEIVNHGVEVSFPIAAPPVEMRYDPRPEVLFGDAEEGLFLSVERLDAIFGLVSNDILPRFSPLLA